MKRLLILALALALALCATGAGTAAAAQSAHVSAVFRPERLGAHTTVSLGFSLSGGADQLPAPLTGIDFNYPPDLGIARSDLGVASCDPGALEAHGAAACPPNSIMGGGSAAVEVPIGPEIVRETATIALVAGPSEHGYLNLLVAATGITPVAARIVMPTLLLGGHMHITVPLVQSLPEGPNVAVVAAHVTLGGHLTYVEKAHGRSLPYHPKGVVLPKRCPRGGFRFAGTFSFLDGTQASAATTVPCPTRR